MSAPLVPPQLAPLLEPITALKPHPKNVKNRHDIQAIASALQEHGWHAPVVATRTGEIIVGNGRYKAAKRLGCQQIPVLRVDDDTAASVRRMISDNRTSDLSHWDAENFASLIGDLGAPTFTDLDLPPEFSRLLDGPDLRSLVTPDPSSGTPPEAGAEGPGAGPTASRWEVVIYDDEDGAIAGGLEELGNLKNVEVRRLR